MWLNNNDLIHNNGAVINVKDFIDEVVKDHDVMFSPDVSGDGV